MTLPVFEGFQCYLTVCINLYSFVIGVHVLYVFKRFEYSQLFGLVVRATTA